VVNYISKPSDPSTMPSRKTVALVLGSGSSRGWAHIGAIEALVEEGIPIDFISGCSVGSYVGAIYASGSLDSLKELCAEHGRQEGLLLL
jgi:predicted acylesterase/phospholipase RssA